MMTLTLSPDWTFNPAFSQSQVAALVYCYRLIPNLSIVACVGDVIQRAIAV
jgi:hypothetical protein